jgi:hypothetical protein
VLIPIFRCRSAPNQQSAAFWLHLYLTVISTIGAEGVHPPFFEVILKFILLTMCTLLRQVSSCRSSLFLSRLSGWFVFLRLLISIRKLFFRPCPTPATPQPPPLATIAVAHVAHSTTPSRRRQPVVCSVSLMCCRDFESNVQSHLLGGSVL